MHILKTLPFLLAMSYPAYAEPPKVVTDIAPVHALVAAVMDGVSTPSLLLEPGASPHHSSLRPSQVRDLTQADLVVWIGAGLTPWLHDNLEPAPDGTHILTLAKADGITELSFRDGLAHDDHDAHDEERAHDDHDDDHGHADHDADHGHDDHDADHAADAYDEDKEHSEHADDHADEHSDEHDHEHAHGDTDPHLWLNPDNAQVWLTRIAEELTELDPENAAIYRQNAQAMRDQLEALTQEIAENLTGSSAGYVAGHDSYQYFETKFGLSMKGAISLGDASKPGPARIKAIRDLAQDSGPTCLAVDVAMSPDLIATVAEDTNLVVRVIDPLGAKLTPGPELYPQLLKDIAEEFKTCLEPGT